MTTLQKGSRLKDGKYCIERVLGQGGFGITYLASTMSTIEGTLGALEVEIKVAVKEFFMSEYQVRKDDMLTVGIPSQGAAELVSQYQTKFVKEAQNLARMNHPNIVKVADVFEENGTVYYVMGYLSGGSLQQRVRQSANGRLNESEALRYVRDISDALDYMHNTCHVCHFDVKPGNILFDDKGHAVLIDFGLSKNYDSEGHQTSSTPVGISNGFAPLEQYRQNLENFSPQTDVYSLGATLFFMLTGQVPPEASIVNEDGLPACPEGVSKETWRLVETAMQPRRKDRPASVRQWLELSPTPTDAISENEQVETELILKKEKQSPKPVAQQENLTELKMSPTQFRWLKRGLLCVLLVNVLLGLNTLIGYLTPMVDTLVEDHYIAVVANAPVPFHCLRGHALADYDENVYESNAYSSAISELQEDCLVSGAFSLGSFLFAWFSLFLIGRNKKKYGFVLGGLALAGLLFHFMNLIGWIDFLF